MTDADAIQCWLVERTYTDRGLVDMTYATPDGSRAHRRQVSTTVMRQRGAGTRERYASEVERMRGDHGPDDEV